MNPSIRRNAIAALVALTLLWSCTETEFDKVLLPTTEVAGEYVVTLELEALDITDEQHIRLFNPAVGGDTVFHAGLNIFVSQVTVPHTDYTTFAITNSVDTPYGVDLRVSFQVFAEQHSIHGPRTAL